MNNITNGVLEDVEGSAHTLVYNNAKIVAVKQLKYALQLDGSDDWVDTGIADLLCTALAVLIRCKVQSGYNPVPGYEPRPRL